MTVSSEQLRTLQAHFADGPPALAGVTADTMGPPPPITLNILKVTVPAHGDGPVIATDGSAQNHQTSASARIVAGAAVATDGRMRVGWWETPTDSRVSLYTEWQAARLGLRLAARYPDGVTLITDQMTVAEQIRRAVAGQPLHGIVISGVDRETISEIISLTRGRLIKVIYRSGTADKPNRTAATPLGRIAHAGAWLVQRLVADGFNPREHASWIAEVVANPTRDQPTLRRRYLRHISRQADPEWQRDASLRDFYL